MIGLKQAELLSTPRFQIERTMSAFEVMDKKMDIRLHAREAMTPKKALKLGVIKSAKNLSLSEVKEKRLTYVGNWNHR